MKGGIAAATLRRVLLEVGLLAGLLTALLLAVLAPHPGDDRGWAMLTLGLAYVGLVGGVVGALRLRRSVGERVVRRELGRGAVVLFTLWLSVWLTLVTTGLVAPQAVTALLDPMAFVFGAPVFSLFTVVLGAPALGLLRSLALLWPTWDRLRRTRLLWALTHAQLKVSLALALLVAVALTRLSAGYNPWTVPVPSAYSGTARFIVRVLPEATAFLVLGALAVLVLVPLAALITWSVLRRTTRSLEDLARATDALRTGQPARVTVSGEDEVARLQADFNAMAADLERTLGALHTERDRVVGLLAAQRELVAGVSHELRTPVATVRAYLDSSLANWNGGPPPSLHHDLTVMAAETERLQRLIDDLFTLSRAEVGRLTLQVEPTDVAALLRRCVETAGPLAWARGRVEVVVAAPTQPLPALADAGRLEQAVHNLIANAVRHTPPGGLVLLTAERGEDAVRLQVKDSGEGIAPEDLPHIWERFYRTDKARDRDQGGAGLGLALVRELVEAMGGSVSAESVVGQGSCFTLRLPQA